jgi:uncharacterized protein (DUF58 family)
MERLVVNMFEGAFSSSVSSVRGLELDELRQYQPGDDFRSIDWKTTARTRKLHTRVRLTDKRAVIMFLIDRSKSKHFSSSPLHTKEDIQDSILRLLVYASSDTGNEVGFVTFTDRIERYFPPQQGERLILRIIDRMRSERLSGSLTDLNCALGFLNDLNLAPCLVFILSDFLAPYNYEGYMRTLSQKHDIVPIVITDKREVEIPKGKGFLSLRDLETEEIRVVNLSVGLEETPHHIKLFKQLNMDYLVARTDEAEECWIKMLSGFFEKRMRRRWRVRK